jgi:Carbohydrate family 9 binding domain-like
MRSVTSTLLAGVTALLLGACVGGSSSRDSAKERERLKDYVLNSAPAKIGVTLNINFDNKLTLLGAKTEPSGTAKPGERVKVTMYWRTDKKLDSGWSLFTHILDGSGERILNIDNVGPLRELKGGEQALGPGDWEQGKVYVDEQTFTIPAAVKTDRLQLVTGVWKGDDRLKVVAGPHDTSNRGVVTTLTITSKKPAKSTRVPSLRVERLDDAAKIKVDGKLDEEAWKSAPVAGPFIDVRTGDQNTAFPVNGSVKLLWNDEGIFLGFDVKDPDIVGGFKKGEKDPHLWTKDTVEVMIDPEGDGDNKDYYEIQINPQNLVFDSQFDEYNTPKKEPDGPFGHQEWTANLKSAISVEGTIDESGDKDQGYVVEAMLPWKAFSKAKKLPPEPGSTWRMNFYAMQNNGGVSWSPILGQGNFHKASRFGRVTFAEKGLGVPKPVPSGAASAEPPDGVIQRMRTPPLKMPTAAPAIPAAPARLPE